MSLKSFLPFVAFVVIIGIGVLAHSFDVKWLVEIYGVLDTSSAVALAIFASWGFYEYTKETDKKQKYLKELDKILQIKGVDGAIVIKFGSRANITDGIAFAKSKVNDENLILAKDFGEIVNVDDVLDLEAFLTECRTKLANASVIHLIFAGASIGYAIIGDNLSNWKVKNFYHYDNGSYKPWYIDKASRNKISELGKQMKEITELQKFKKDKVQ
jgi:hypothetical protein